jgi:hypothetical protein
MRTKFALARFRRMDREAEFRRQAKQAGALAAKAFDPAVQRKFREIAYDWLALASLAEAMARLPAARCVVIRPRFDRRARPSNT